MDLLTEFLNRFWSIRSQSDLALKAIDSFKNNVPAISAYFKEETGKFIKIFMDGMKASGDNPNEKKDLIKRSTRQYIELTANKLPGQLNKIYNRIRQNEVLLELSLFEIFLKDLHRKILAVNPVLLKANRKVDLGYLIAHGKDKVLQDEIEREIQELDRKSWKVRAEYFRDTLGIDWSSKVITTSKLEIVPNIKKIFDLRNKILHEDPDTLINNEDRDLVAAVCMEVSSFSYGQAVARYPSTFEKSLTDKLKEIHE